MLIQIKDTPWKAQNELWRRLAYPRIRLLFAANGISWGQGWRFYGVPVIQKHRHSQMAFGPGLQLRSSIRSNPLGPNHPVFITTWRENAILEVGANFGMTGGTICSTTKIQIGDNVDIGANSTIIDTDFHSIDPKQRMSEPSGGLCAPITIEDDVFVGMNCLILKGVTIGQSSIIGAGSVVTKNIPAGVIAAGNPARVIRKLTTENMRQEVVRENSNTGYHPSICS